MVPLSRIVFPFRRLAVWLTVLVLGVGALALGVSALLVVPQLRSSLVDSRVHTIAKAAHDLGPVMTGSVVGRPSSPSPQEAADGVYRVTGNRVAVLQVVGADDLLLQAGDPADAANDPLALESLAAGRAAARVVHHGGRYAAEATYPLVLPDGRRYIVLFVASLADVSNTVSTVRHTILIAALVALPLAWLVGVLAAAALAARIRRLERASRAIAAGTLTEPLADGGRDEVAQLVAAFEDMRRRLERTDRARREFIANASHELRTPLFALGGFLELFEDEDDPAIQREFLATMRGQVARMTRLATDLLDLSRLDAGQVSVQREEVELGEVAELLQGDFRALAERCRSTVAIDARVRVVAIADEARVGQVARALTDNALRHNPPGTTVSVHVRAENDRAVLEVADDGPAVPPEAVDRLFDRFYRGAGAGEGSGLGLAIAAELATRMDGSLELRQDGAGKAFVLALPVASAAVPETVG